MKIKDILLIFLIGIVVGVIISPLAKLASPQNITSPLSLTQAQTCPATENKEKILGLEKSSPQKSFAELIKEGQEKPVEAEMEENKLSLYEGKIEVAVFGDSMVDVMGTSLPYLRSYLQNYYPQAQLQLFNYGIGAQNIEQALTRIEENYHYQERDYPSLPELNPDIIVLGSFSYNPFEKDKDELYQHWANLAVLVDLIKNKTSSRIIMLAEIAPNKENFGQGPKGVNWSAEVSQKHAVKIQEYLKNTISFAKAYELPLADAYSLSLVENEEGNLKYINSEDHIHQNSAGNNLMAQLIAQEIFSLNLFSVGKKLK